MKPFKFLFHKSSFALLGSLLFLWSSIGLLHDTSLNNEDLIPHVGTVVHIDSILTLSGRSASIAGKESFLLRVVIHTEPNILFFATPLKKYGDFNFITSKVNLGDQVTIFTKPRLWKIFGLKRANDISRLVKKDEVVISYESFKQKVLGLPFFTAAMSVGLAIWYIFSTRRRLRKIAEV